MEISLKIDFLLNLRLVEAWLVKLVVTQFLVAYLQLGSNPKIRN